MNNTLFEQNVAAFTSTQPSLAQMIRHTSMEGLQVEAVQTKSKAVSARILYPGTQRPVLLHSAYDPVRESLRLVDHLQIKEPTNVIVLGIGLGYHLISLLNRYENLLRYCIVIERDPRIMRLAMMALDLRSVLSLKGMIWVVGEEPVRMPELIQEARTDIILHNCKILTHEPSVKADPTYYKEAKEKIFDAITHDEVNLRTTFESHGRNQFNIYMNIPAVYKGYALQDCENLFKGYPAIVSAAGPSIDKNIEQLHNLQDRAPLFIVDTAQSTYKQIGIEPDVVVTADPTPLNFSHFENIDDLGEAFLAFHPEANRQITQKFLSHPYLLPLFDKDSIVHDYLFDVQNNYGMMKRAMNVGHIAFHLAHHMGCDPIILIGFDFAFPKEGGTTHSRNAALSRSVSRYAQDGTVVIGAKEGKTMEESGHMTLVPGYYGDQVPTTVPFQQYIKAIERTVAECEVKVIDATEGGAHFEGTIKMPLHEALQQFLQNQGVKQHLEAFRRKKKQPNLERVLSRLQEGKEVLTKSQNMTKQMKQYINRWNRLLTSGDSVQWSEVQSTWNEFEDIWLTMVGDPRFDGFLGTTVQYLYFRRQRTTLPRDDSPEAYLECIVEKYSFILNEMQGLLDQFIHCIDLSIMALKATAQSEPSIKEQ